MTSDGFLNILCLASYLMVGVMGIFSRPAKTRVRVWIVAFSLLIPGVIVLVWGFLWSVVDIWTALLIFWPAVGCLIGEFVQRDTSDVRRRWVVGVQADLFISPDEQAVRYELEPEQFAGSVSHRGITTLELTALWALLRESDEVVDAKEGFRLVLDRGCGLLTINRLPAAMVADLARLTPERMERLVKQWSSGQWLWPSFSSRQVVADLVWLSRLAREKGWSVYLWNRQVVW